MRPQTAEALRLINEAFELYAQNHEFTPDQELEARLDFARFYGIVLGKGLKGIRWNFNGCIACEEPIFPTICRRILLVHPLTQSAAGGRGFGTLVCGTHDAAMDTDEGLARIIIPGALRRIAEQPPIAGAA